MVKEKDNEDQLELVIVDFDQGTKILVQKDLGDEGCANMRWDDNTEFYCYNELGDRQHIHLINDLKLFNKNSG